MSRKKGDFEYRTSIFEGGYRAWSHLGGLEPEDLANKSEKELNPLKYPIENDSRTTKTQLENYLNPDDGSRRRWYPYEQLPRVGLRHPFVGEILTEWLGDVDSDKDAEDGLTVLRNWWQHRRKGESQSAVTALKTQLMTRMVDSYTSNFFTLAHCMVTEDGEPAPKTLQTKMKAYKKEMRSLRKRARKESDRAAIGNKKVSNDNAGEDCANLVPESPHDVGRTPEAPADDGKTSGELVPTSPFAAMPSQQQTTLDDVATRQESDEAISDLSSSEESNLQTSQKQQSTSRVTRCNDNDILFRRGVILKGNSGNDHFRALVLKHQSGFSRRTDLQKGILLLSVVNDIRNRNPPGRFLEEDEDRQSKKTWSELGEKQALERTRQLFQECEAEVLGKVYNHSIVAK